MELDTSSDTVVYLVYFTMDQLHQMVTDLFYCFKGVLEKPTYSWQQDEQIIFFAVNKVAGKEVRNLTYLHWWTFLGHFNEIGEGNFSFIVGIRDKLNKGKS